MSFTEEEEISTMYVAFRRACARLRLGAGGYVPVPNHKDLQGDGCWVEASRDMDVGMLEWGSDAPQVDSQDTSKRADLAKHPFLPMPKVFK